MMSMEIEVIHEHKLCCSWEREKE